MKTNFLYLLAFLFVIGLTSCSEDDSMKEPDTNEESGGDGDGEESGGGGNEDDDPIPDKTSTYEADVKGIMTAHCIECHSNPPQRGAPMSLETFGEVVEAQNNRALFERVSTTGSNVMPASGRLPDETILLIEDWIADGMLENN